MFGKLLVNNGNNSVDWSAITIKTKEKKIGKIYEKETFGDDIIIYNNILLWLFIFT